MEVCDGLIIIMGISNTISISNTKNTTANRKNRMEKGSRAEDNGSNPHSNGDIFSRSLREWDDNIKVTKIKRSGKIIEVIIVNKGSSINKKYILFPPN